MSTPLYNASNQALADQVHLVDSNGVAIDSIASAVAVGYDVATTVTRAANTTAYTSGDVVGGALDLGVLGVSTRGITLVSTQLEYDVAALPSGMANVSLYLYSVTPPSAIADNGAWDLPAGDRPSFLGKVALGTLVDLGSTLYVEVNNIQKRLRLAGTHLFGYLVTDVGFTPAGNSEVLVVTLHTVGN